jgi:uncharacterized membrane protein YcaP (DUF421 family)
MSEIDWAALFVPRLHPAELFVRGTIMYLGLFVVMRILRREAGAIGISDLLVVVLIADAAQNAMASDYQSITEGAILVGTIVFWNYVLDWLSYRFPSLRNVLQPPPLTLIKDGRCNFRSMRQEMISEEELLGLLREHGIEHVRDVKQAWLERDGRVSVIKKDPDTDSARDDERPHGAR